MAIEPSNFDGEEDPTPDAPQEGVDNPRLPADSHEAPEQEEIIDDQQLADIAAEVGKQLEEAEEPEDEEALDGGYAPPPEPTPFDSTVLPNIKVPYITDLPKGGDPTSLGGDSELPSETIESRGAAPGIAELDEAGRALEAFGNDVEAFHAGALPPADDPGEVAGGGNDGGHVPEALDADFKHKETSTDYIIEHIRKINELTARLERERI